QCARRASGSPRAPAWAPGVDLHSGPRRPVSRLSAAGRLPTGRPWHCSAGPGPRPLGRRLAAPIPDLQPGHPPLPPGQSPVCPSNKRVHGNYKTNKKPARGEITMKKDIVAEVLKHPKYQELVRRRTRVSMGFFGVTLLIYASFILTMAYLPEVFAQPLGGNWTMSVGLFVGLLVVCSAVLLIALYTYFSNKVFDPLLDAIMRDVE